MELYQFRDCRRTVSRPPHGTMYKLMISLIDFFRFFSHDFQFNNSVLSLRAGPLTKESKGWVNDVSPFPVLSWDFG